MAERPRLYILDTNVLMHDPTALFRFAEHDIFLPMIVLEELDRAKRARRECRATGARATGSLAEWWVRPDGWTAGLPRPDPTGCRWEGGAGGRSFQPTALTTPAG